MIVQYAQHFACKYFTYLLRSKHVRYFTYYKANQTKQIIPNNNTAVMTPLHILSNIMSLQTNKLTTL